MKSMDERVEELTSNPDKFRKLFNITWIVAYGMLILGFAIIVWVLLQGYY